MNEDGSFKLWTVALLVALNCLITRVWTEYDFYRAFEKTMVEAKLGAYTPDTGEFRLLTRPEICGEK